MEFSSNISNILFSHEKGGFLPSATTQMNLEHFMLRRLSDKDKYCIISYLKIKMESKKSQKSKNFFVKRKK